MTDVKLYCRKGLFPLIVTQCLLCLLLVPMLFCSVAQMDLQQGCLLMEVAPWPSVTR